MIFTTWLLKVIAMGVILFSVGVMIIGTISCVAFMILDKFEGE